jgi:glycosyltransferase involved in cell wall biosynthesis
MNSNNQIVSIIVRTNQDKRLSLLKNALLSIISNDYRPIEIIVVVQSEAEDFIQKIHDFSRKLINEQIQIKLVVNNTSQDERAKNLNLGINAAKGRYIGFLDDDDIIYQDHISCLIKEINTSESASWAYSQVAMSICNLDDDKVNILSLDYPFKKERFTLQEILKDNFIPIHSYLIDRNKYDPDFICFDESFPVLEDYEFLLRLLHRSKPTFINDVTCEYRFYIKHSDSNTNIDIYSILDHRESENAKIWLEAGERIEKAKKKLYPEYSSGLISSNKRKFLLSSFPFLNIIKKRFPKLWKSIKYLSSIIRLI